MRILTGPDRTFPGTAGTPAVDLLLVALVCAAVVQSGWWFAQRLETGSEPVAAPNPAPPPPQQIVLTLRADGLCLINGAAVDPRGLGDRLRALYRDRPVKLLFVEAAPDLPFGRIQKAAEAAYRAGVLTIGWLPSATAPAGRRGGQVQDRLRARPHALGDHQRHHARDHRHEP